eukprot:5000410-Prymnesium_polylepis.1
MAQKAFDFYGTKFPDGTLPWRVARSVYGFTPPFSANFRAMSNEALGEIMYQDFGEGCSCVLRDRRAVG